MSPRNDSKKPEKHKLKMPTGFTGQVYCVCGMPYKDSISPIVALLGEYMETTVTAVFVYVKHCVTRYDEKLNRIFLTSYEDSEDYGSLPADSFVDYLLDVKDYTNDYNGLKREMESFGSSNLAKELVIPDSGIKVIINRSYRTFKTLELTSRCFPLSIHFRNLEDWPLLLLLRGFTHLYNQYIRAITNGHSSADARKLAIIEYRKIKAIEAGYLNHRRKLTDSLDAMEELNFSAERRRPVGLPTEAEESMQPEEPLRLRNSYLGPAPDLSAPRLKRQYGSPRLSGEAVISATRYSTIRTRYSDSRRDNTTVRLNMTGRDMSYVLTRNERYIREQLELSPIRSLNDQITARTEINSGGSEDLIVQRREEMPVNKHFRIPLEGGPAPEALERNESRLRELFNIPREEATWDYLTVRVSEEFLDVSLRDDPEQFHVAPLDTEQLATEPLLPPLLSGQIATGVPEPPPVNYMQIALVGQSMEDVEYSIRERFHIPHGVDLSDYVITENDADTLIIKRRTEIETERRLSDRHALREANTHPGAVASALDSGERPRIRTKSMQEPDEEDEDDDEDDYEDDYYEEEDEEV